MTISDRDYYEYDPSEDDDFDVCPTCKGSGTVNPLTAPKGVLCLSVMDCPHCDGGRI